MRPLPEFIIARAQAGAPMPHELRAFINEDVFYNLRNECVHASTEQAFFEVIRRYNAMYGWEGAVTGQYNHISFWDGLLNDIFTLGGLFFGGSVQARAKLLLFRTSFFLHAQPHVVQMAPIQQGHIVSSADYMAGSAPPVAYAVPVQRY